MLETKSEIKKDFWYICSNSVSQMFLSIFNILCSLVQERFYANLCANFVSAYRLRSL